MNIDQARADSIFDGVLAAVVLPSFLAGQAYSGEMYFAEGLRILSDLTADLLADSDSHRATARKRLEKLMATGGEVKK